MTTHYTLGFLFDRELQRVVLVQKAKPDWQRGKLNGVGGHVEQNETPDECMAREFKEEVQSDVIPAWKGFALMSGKDFEVFCYTAKSDLTSIVRNPSSEEPVWIVQVDKIGFRPVTTIENVPWLLALAVDHLEDGRPTYCYIDYRK